MDGFSFCSGSYRPVPNLELIKTLVQATVEELKAKACAALELLESDVILWDYYDCVKRAINGNLTDTIEEARLLDSQSLMLSSKVKFLLDSWTKSEYVRRSLRYYVLLAGLDITCKQVFKSRSGLLPCMLSDTKRIPEK